MRSSSPRPPSFPTTTPAPPPTTSTGGPSSPPLNAATTSTTSGVADSQSSPHLRRPGRRSGIRVPLISVASEPSLYDSLLKRSSSSRSRGNGDNGFGFGSSSLLSGLSSSHHPSLNRYRLAGKYVKDAIAKVAVDIEARQLTSPVYHFFALVRRSVYWEWLVKLVILMHCALIVIEEDHAYDEQATALVEAVFLVVYVCDVVFGLVDLGFRRYVRNKWSVTYMLVVAVLLLDVVLVLFTPATTRLLRALRPVLLLCKARTLHRIFKTMMRVLPCIAPTLGLAGLLITVYAVVGVALFRGMYDDEFQNFDNFANSALAMAVLLTTENFPDVLYPALRETPIVASVFFVTYIAVGVWLYMSLLLAVVFDYYKTCHEDDTLEARVKQHQSLIMAFSVISDKQKVDKDDRRSSYRLHLDDRPFVPGEGGDGAAEDETINFRSFRKMMRFVRPSASEDECRVLFRLLDVDDNGDIDSREFLHLVDVLQYRIVPVTQAKSSSGSDDSDSDWYEEEEEEEEPRKPHRGGHGRFYERNHDSDSLDSDSTDYEERRRARQRRRRRRGKLRLRKKRVARQYRACSEAVGSSTWFRRGMQAVLLTNLAALMMWEANMSDDQARLLDLMNRVCLFLFGVEAIVLISAMSFPQYLLKHPFDFGILLVSIPAEALLADSVAMTTASPDSVCWLQIFRALRTFKIVSLWPSIKHMVLTLARSMGTMFRLIGLLLISFYIYAVVGMELFDGNVARNERNPHNSEATDDYNPERFTTFWKAMLALFQISTTNNWNSVMYSTMINFYESFYFVSFYFWICMVMLNILTALIIDTYTIYVSKDDTGEEVVYFKFEGDLGDNYAGGGGGDGGGGATEAAHATSSIPELPAPWSVVIDEHDEFDASAPLKFAYSEAAAIERKRRHDSLTKDKKLKVHKHKKKRKRKVRRRSSSRRLSRSHSRSRSRSRSRTSLGLRDESAQDVVSVVSDDGASDGGDSPVKRKQKKEKKSPRDPTKRHTLQINGQPLVAKDIDQLERSHSEPRLQTQNRLLSLVRDSTAIEGTGGGQRSELLGAADLPLAPDSSSSSDDAGSRSSGSSSSSSGTSVLSVESAMSSGTGRVGSNSDLRSPLLANGFTPGGPVHSPRRRRRRPPRRKVRAFKVYKTHDWTLALVQDRLPEMREREVTRLQEKISTLQEELNKRALSRRRSATGTPSGRSFSSLFSSKRQVVSETNVAPPSSPFISRQPSMLGLSSEDVGSPRMSSMAAEAAAAAAANRQRMRDAEDAEEERLRADAIERLRKSLLKQQERKEAEVAEERRQRQQREFDQEREELRRHAKHGDDEDDDADADDDADGDSHHPRHRRRATSFESNTSDLTHALGVTPEDVDPFRAHSQHDNSPKSATRRPTWHMSERRRRHSDASD